MGVTLLTSGANHRSSRRCSPLVVGTEAQRKRAVIHTFVRADDAGERPSAVNQKVPGFAGLQAVISAPVERSNAF